MKIVGLDLFTVDPGDNSWSPVEELGELTIYDRTPTDLVVERALPAQILMANKATISAEIMDQLPNLKYIAVTATGYNVIDIAAAQERGIPVSNVPEYSTESVAQHVFAMLLSALHQPYAHDAAIRGGEWQRRGDFAFWLKPIVELTGLTIGIVGFGKIGQAVARRAAAFGMKVLAFNPRQKSELEFRDFEWCDLDSLLSRSDFVTLHCPQTDETAGMVDRNFVSKMKPTSILVNASRGGLVNESELTDALNEGVIAGACLDVVSAEPIVETNPLLNAKNCLLTPHVAWASLRARKRLVQITADNIRAFQNGHPINIVNA